jgi:ribosomal protein S18 acetylase RimI-like enzyme
MATAEFATDTNAVPVVRGAGDADLPALADVLSVAFHTDPVFEWMIPDPARRAELNPRLFRILLEGHLPLGRLDCAQTGGDHAPVAASVWVPEDSEPDADGEAELSAAFMEVAAENADRLQTLLGMLNQAHPQDPHAYLFVLGTHPQRQSQGLGSALIRHVTQRLDRHGVPAYLEATCEDNRRLYARHGFADVGVLRLPDGPPVFCMWRDPRCA